MKASEGASTLSAKAIWPQPIVISNHEVLRFEFWSLSQDLSDI